jgi:hypothetical protein
MLNLFMENRNNSLALMEGKILFVRFFGGQKDWNDSRTTVLGRQKIVAPKKNTIFAGSFLHSIFETLKTSEY